MPTARSSACTARSRRARAGCRPSPSTTSKRSSASWRAPGESRCRCSSGSCRCTPSATPSSCTTRCRASRCPTPLARGCATRASRRCAPASKWPRRWSPRCGVTTPARDATCVARLRAAGAIVLGKTHTTQFAYRDPAPTTNPWNPAHTPGGSSSGSAAAVAAREVPVALGSQTVGSILRPAAYNGIVGLKGTNGLVPLDGVVPLGYSLDHIGPLARSVEDCALVLSVMAGRSLAPEALEAPRLAVARDLFDPAQAASPQHIV